MTMATTTGHYMTLDNAFHGTRNVVLVPAEVTTIKLARAYVRQAKGYGGRAMRSLFCCDARCHCWTRQAYTTERYEA
jgi:hypothetical protein